MSKRRREAEANEKTDRGYEKDSGSDEKRTKESSDGGELKV